MKASFAACSGVRLRSIAVVLALGVIARAVLAELRSLVTAERTVLRSDSTYESSRLRVLPRQVSVTFLGYQSDVTGYMLVAAGADTGWVPGELLRESPAASEQCGPPAASIAASSDGR